MRDFISKHSEKITGTLSCFDRMLFKGYLPLGWAEGMESFIGSQGFLLKDFKRFVSVHSETIREHAEGVAKKAGRPYIYLNGQGMRKEDEVRRIAERDGVTEGLICVLRAVEPCQSFKVMPGKGRPRLVNAPRKCLCFYYYFIDREFGLMHVRIQSWFPLVIQICINGHEWLARKLDKHEIAYHKDDNAFLWIADCARAQRFADRFVSRNWPRILSAFARKVNPLLKNLLSEMNYYWVIDQAEFATDVMFESHNALGNLYENLLKHAVLHLSAEDVLTFLGRKLNGNFKGEVLTDLKKKRYPGARVKHRMCENWIKMYDKCGCVLRVETVINQPRQFKVRRMGKRDGVLAMGWYPMAKGVANLYRYRQIALSANRNYLQALAEVHPLPSINAFHALARPVKRAGRSYRGFNPANPDDQALFAAVTRGEHALMGFRNQDIRRALFPIPRSAHQQRQQANRVSRILKRLHTHHLVAKIPRSRRWRLTKTGRTTITAALTFQTSTLQQAA